MGIFICAILKAKEGKVDELHSLMDKVFKNVQNEEPNTIQYQIVKNSKKPNEVIVFEEYTDEAAIKFHAASDAFQAFSKAVPDLCEGGKIDLKRTQLIKRHFSKGFPSKL